MGLSVAKRTLAWHNSERTCKCARDSAVGAIYGLLRGQCRRIQEPCIATTRTRNARAANRRAPASKETHIRVSRLIYAPQLKRVRAPTTGRSARMGRGRGEIAPLFRR